MDASTSDLTASQIARLRRALKTMPREVLYNLANTYDIELPTSIDTFEVIENFLDELSLEGKKTILTQYGDAGKASSFLFMSREKAPSIQAIFPKAKTLSDTKPESHLWENYPYYDEVEVDHTTRTLRVRFHYLLGQVSFVDEIGKPKEHRRLWRGVAVYRPESPLLEIRTKFRGMARKMAARIPAYLGIEPFFSINLIEEKMNKRFIDWITSLNSATIELPLSDVTGSLIMTARKGVDLRTAKRYQEELRYGRLRHGHVTIKIDGENKINFHIYFRDCHLKYTLFSDEAGIEYVTSAIQKICEGYSFERPEKILTEYFGKKD